ncbi:MAG: HEPN domain-containing protein [Rhodomicrobium sp.]
MKEESALYLEKARWHLANASTIAAAKIPEVAAREAYYAAFHAAACYIFEQTGHAGKTHRGVHGEFSRLAKDDPQVPKDLLPLLGQAYDYKSLSDYEVGPLARIYAGDALDMIQKATRFVDCIATRLQTGGV